MTKKNNIQGTYLFRLYDSNDETKMKIILTHREYCQNEGEISELVRILLGRGDGAWLEVYKYQRSYLN